MTMKEAKKINVEGMRLVALATVFGVEESPVGTTSVRLQLGLAIWPGDPLLTHRLEVEGWGPNEWRKRIIAEGCTPAAWAKMTAKKAKVFEVEGRGLDALARVFGIEGDPVGYTSVRLQLGLAIWPGDPLLTHRLEVEGWGLMSGGRGLLLRAALQRCGRR